MASEGQILKGGKTGVSPESTEYHGRGNLSTEEIKREIEQEDKFGFKIILKNILSF